MCLNNFEGCRMMKMAQAVKSRITTLVGVNVENF